MNDKIGKCNFLEIARNAWQNFKNSKPATPQLIVSNENPCLTVFASKENMNIWLFCSQNKIPLNQWLETYYKIHGQSAASDYTKKPTALPLNSNGQPSDSFIADYCQPESCKLCWGLGIAYKIAGILRPITDIPGKLIGTVCSCQEILKEQIEMQKPKSKKSKSKIAF